MMKSWVFVDEFSDETSPAHDLDGWAKWLAQICPDGIDGPTREVNDGEVLKVYITDGEYVDATVKNGKATFLPDLPDSDHYGITWAHGGGWTEDDYYPTRAHLIEGLVERAKDGEGPVFVVCGVIDRKGEFTATFSRTPDGPVLQPDGWSL